MFDVGGGELLLIVMAVLLLFGPEKLPELARSFGKGMAQLRKAQTEFQRNMNAMTDEVEELVQKQHHDDAATNAELPAFERSLALNSTEQIDSSAQTPFDAHTEASLPPDASLPAEESPAAASETPTVVIRPAENAIAIDPKNP
jgi:Tat protein translocase TatB subunit